MTDKPYVLILGASGLTGTEVVRHLFHADVSVRVTYRESTEVSFLRNFGVELFNADYDDIDSIRKAMRGIDRMVLILPADREFGEWGREIVQCAKRVGVQRVVYLSNIIARPTADSYIARTHSEVESHLAAAAIPHTVVRPSPYFQNMLWSSITILRNSRFSLPLENTKIPHIDVRDVAQALAQALLADDDRHINKKYDVTGPAALSMFDVARIITECTEHKVRYTPTPQNLGYNFFRDFGWSEGFAKMASEIYLEYIKFPWERVRNQFGVVAGRAGQRAYKDFISENKNFFVLPDRQDGRGG